MDIKLHENPSSDSLVAPCGQAGGQTDKHDEANSRFLQFSEHYKKFLFHRNPCHTLPL